MKAIKQYLWNLLYLLARSWNAEKVPFDPVKQIPGD